MSEAVLNLVTRDAVELHFEGATYGPVAHTEPLGVLLHVLAPSTVRCIAGNAGFEKAMRRMLAAARATCSTLERAQVAHSREAREELPSEDVDRWVSAAWSAVPRERAEDFRRRCLDRAPQPRGRTLH